ncbi:MAG TPA: HAD hydrolase family protein [Verrucomicrobiae bacterium]|nr:HAD hydrolase family protein [Verrucomicrobiae bacterium]
MRHFDAHAETVEPVIRTGAGARARKVKLILMDVDGVLTDGRIIFDDTPGEMKFFDAQDGVGVRLAERVGLKFGIITGRESQALERRCREIGITELHQRSLKKIVAYEKILASHKLKDEDVAFMGDDIVDAPVLKRVGFAVTVPNAVPQVRRLAHFVTSRAGGRGAVRQALDFILKVQNRWGDATRGYA